MPQIIRHIDQICVEKARDILFIDFQYDRRGDTDYLRQDLPYIKETLEWLDQNDIQWEQTGPLSNSGWLSGYVGWYYVDVPYDTTNPQYKLLEAYLENPDGTMKDPNKVFCYITLEICKPALEESRQYNYLEDLIDAYDDKNITEQEFFELATARGIGMERSKEYFETNKGWNDAD